MTEPARTAPVTASSTIEIDAEPDVVWDLLVDVERWPDWSPGVREATLEGDVEPGSSFRWRAGRARITSTFTRVERPALVEWSGRTAGLRALHRFELAPSGGGTRVETTETFDGLAARLLRGPLRRMLQRTLDEGLRALERAAESRP